MRGITALAADERGTDRVWRGVRDGLGWLRTPRQTLLIGAFTAKAHVSWTKQRFTDGENLSLFNYQKEDIFRILTHERLNPEEFRWEMRRGVHSSVYDRGHPTLVHGSSGHFFQVREGHYGRLSIKYSPALQIQTCEAWDLEWDEVSDHVSNWATILRRELKSIDPWLELGRQRASLVAARHVTNAPFSDAELAQLRESIDALGNEIRRTQSLNKIHTDLILGAIEDASRSAERVGRKDWIMILLGQLLSSIAEAGIDGDTARNILAATGAALSWVTGVMPTLPAP